MTKEFIPYEQALALKELGFDYPCVAIYIEGRFMFSGGSVTYKSGHKYYPKYAAPLYQQAFRWFREKYNLQHEILRSGTKMWLLTIKEIDKVTKHEVFNGRVYKLEEDNWIEPVDYEEAELACLRKLIEIVKKNKDE